MYWRRILLITAVALTAMAFAAIVVLETYDYNRFKPLIARTVREATGRTLAIDGDIDIDWGIYPGISIRNIRMENADWGTQPEMLHLEALELHFSLPSLVFGPVEIHDMILETPELLLENGPDGKSNLVFDPSGPSSGRDPPNLRIERMRIENGHLRYRDALTGSEHHITLERVGITVAEDSSSALIDADGRIDRHAVRVTGQLARPLEVVSTGEPLDVKLNVEGLETVIELDGQVQNPREMSGIEIKLKAVGRATADIFELIGTLQTPELGPFQLNATVGGALKRVRLDRFDVELGRPDSAELKLSGNVGDLLQFSDVDLDLSIEGKELGAVAQKFGQTVPFGGPFRLAGRLTDAKRHRYRVDDVSMTVGPNDLKASADIDIDGARPRIDLKVDSRQIDLLPLFASPREKRIPAEQDGDPHPKRADSEAKISFTSLFSLADVHLEMQTGRIVLPDLILKDLKTTATLSDGQLTLNIDGGQVPDLEALTTLTHMVELGPFQASGQIKPVDDHLTLTDLQFTTGRPATVEVTASGGIQNLFTGRGFDLDFRIQGDDAAKLARYIVEPWPLQGQYLLTGRMNIDDYDELRFESLKGTLAGMPFDGTVIVDLSEKTPMVRIDAASSRLNLRFLTLPGLTLPASLISVSDLGPLDAHLDIAVPGGPVGFDAFRIEFGRPNLLSFKATGNVYDIADLMGVDLKLMARGDDLSGLGAALGTSIPIAEAFEVNCRLKDNRPGSYHFSGLSVVVGTNTLNADIEIDTIPSQPVLKARFDAEAIDLAPLIERGSQDKAGASYLEKTVLQQRLLLPSWPQPPVFIQDTDADIRLQVRKVTGRNFSIHQLQANLRKSLDRIAVEASGFLMAETRQPTTAEPWLDIGRIDLKILASTDKEHLSVDTFHLQAGDPQTIALSVSGTAGDIIEQRGLDVTFALKGDDAAYLNRFYPTHEPLSGPFLLRGHMVDPELKKYEISDLQLSIMDCDLAGNIEIDLAAERPRFEADLTSRQLDLRPFKVAENDADQPSIPEKRSTASKRKVFSTAPLPLNWRDLFDMRLSLKGRQLMLPFAAVDQLHFETTLKDGDLTVEPASFTTGQAHFKGRLTLTNGTGRPETALALTVENYDIGKELGDVGLARNVEGLLNADIDLRGSGDSIADIMAGLNGKVILTLNEGRINDRYIGIIYTDLSATLLKLLRPFGRKDKFIDLNCFVGTFLVQNGKVDSAMVLDTTETTLYSAGKINLKTEELDVTLKSDPKSGLRVKGLGRIGFSLSGLARPFKLGGTLAEPNLEVDPTQTAFTFGKILGGLALGPYGIALLFTDVSIDKQNPCVKELLEADKESP